MQQTPVPVLADAADADSGNLKQRLPSPPVDLKSSVPSLPGDQNFMCKLGSTQARAGQILPYSVLQPTASTSTHLYIMIEAQPDQPLSADSSRVQISPTPATIISPHLPQLPLPKPKVSLLRMDDQEGDIHRRTRQRPALQPTCQRPGYMHSRIVHVTTHACNAAA
jgi:hypothetical protein